MKILLFRDGRAGVAVTLPGEDPERELGELLGGAVEVATLNDRITLVTRKDGEKLGLPLRYARHRIGHEVEPVAGDCAILGVGVAGRLRDVSVQDMAAAECHIRSV